MGLLSVTRFIGCSNKKRIYQPERKPKERRRFCLESLEARTVPATLFVVPSGFPIDSLHFGRIQDALSAAVANDVVQIEPGANTAAIAGGTTLAASASVGDKQITVNGLLAPAQILTIGAETALGDSITPAGGGRFTVTLHTPLTVSHALNEGVAMGTTIGVDNTIILQGDPNAPPANIAARTGIEVWIGTTGATLRNLDFSALQLDTGSSGTVLTNSVVGGVDEAGGGVNNGHNLISGNTLTSSIFLVGNDPGDLTADKVVNNHFPDGATMRVENNDGAMIQGNDFEGIPTTLPNAVFVSDSQNVIVVGNVLRLGGGRSSIPTPGTSAILVYSSLSTTSAVIRDNLINTGGLGTGLLAAANGAKLQVQVQGNDFHGNYVGVEISGDGTSAETVDLGGGTLTSTGGNNFRDFMASGTANGVFAVYLDGTNASTTVSAKNNIWGVADPNAVNKDGTHNTNAGGGPTGTGLVDVGAMQLTANEQFVQTLYHDFLGRTGSVNELDYWVGQLSKLNQIGVSNAIARSGEALRRLVDGFYVKFLGRAADASGETAWVNFLNGGGTEEQVMVGFLSAPEYYDHATAVGTSATPDADFVQSLYLQLLGRPGSGSEINFWLDMLPSSGRGALALSILRSQEFRSDVVLQFYFGLLHRGTRVAAMEVAGWVNSPLDILALEVQFAGTPEFFVGG